MTFGGCEVDVGGGGGGGGGGGRYLSANSCAINNRARFLPAKSSTVNLVNLRSPAYHWSARR